MKSTKNHVQRLAAIAAVVLGSTSAVAAERTMFMHWIGGPNNPAAASGQITFDDTPDFSTATGNYSITQIFDLTLTVSGAGAATAHSVCRTSVRSFSTFRARWTSIAN